MSDAPETPLATTSPTCDSLLELARAAVAAARRRGADEAEARAVADESLSVRIHGEEIERLAFTGHKRLGLRVRLGGQGASASTTDFDRSSVEDLVARVVALARETAPDDERGFPDDPGGPRPNGALDLDDRDPRGLDAELGIAVARAAEDAARGTDPAIRNSEGSEYRGSRGLRAFASSRGLDGSWHGTHYAITSMPVAERDGSRQTDFWYTAARHRGDARPPEEIGRVAAERALRKLGARKIPTTRAPVVFDPETASSLLGQLAQAASGDAIVKGASYLVGKLGEAVAAPAVRVVDDPTLPRGLASRPFDAEGISARRLTVVADGRLSSYLLDTRTARKLGLASTGHAAAEPGTEPVVAPTNLRLEPGTTSQADMIRGLVRGLLVTDLIGFGVNLVTGDYSRGASGLWIENGEIVFPVEEITIAGNLLEMLRGIEAIGEDPPAARSIASPSLLVGAMTIAGA